MRRNPISLIVVFTVFALLLNSGCEEQAKVSKVPEPKVEKKITQPKYLLFAMP